MKLLNKILSVLSLLIAVNCQDIDWSEVKPVVKFLDFIAQQSVPSTPSRARRIVGGRIANPHQFPFQAGLVVRFPTSTGQCSGSLITTKTVLTAGHCLFGSSSTTVILGAHNIREKEPFQQTFVVDRSGYRIHERYDDFSLYNDVALLILPSHAYLTREVQLVSLSYDASDNYMNYITRIGGWGRMSDVTLEISNVLRFVEVSVIPNKECETSFPHVITKGNICTASNQGRSACNGDSGGPLTMTNWDGKNIQIGIVSFGSLYGCEQGAPVVYTKVSEFMPFIISNVK